jgi:DNA invertase Pin-like site-specific DNA recombinase
MEKIQEAEAGFRSLTEAIDTTTAPGRMMMQMVGAFAEFERAILRERTKAGLDAARKRGCIGGRRPKLRPVQQDEIVRWYQWAPKLPLMPPGFSMFIRRRCRGYWLGLVPGLLE